MELGNASRMEEMHFGLYIYKNRGEVKSQNYNGDQLINHNMKGLLHKVFENQTDIS